jgi:hypothetical protein
MADTYPAHEVEVWVGFEAGEEERAAKDPNAVGGKKRFKPKGIPAVRLNRFVLIEAGLCRCRCLQRAMASGLPVPYGSACVFCPYAKKADWQLLAAELPEEFGKVVELEARKPPTTKGFKLSIMGFRKLKDEFKQVIGYRAPALPEYIKGKPRPTREPCWVCGSPQKVRKGMGCGYAA